MAVLRPPSPEAQSARLAVLYDLDLLDGQSVPELDRLTALAADVCGAEVSALTFYDPGGALRVAMSNGVTVSAAPEETLCARVLEAEAPVLIPDARSEARHAASMFVRGAPFVRSYVGAPIGLQDGHPLGVLSVAHSQPGKFGPVETARLERIAELARSVLATRRATVSATRAALQTDAERRRQVQFDLIFDAVHEGVNIYSADGQIIELNPSAEEILGLTRDQQLGRSYIDPRWQIFKQDGSLFAPNEFPVVRALKNGEVLRDVGMGVQLPNGERRWISVNASPVRHAETDLIEFAVVTFKDVTRQRSAEDRVAAQNARLAEALVTAEKASQAKSDFLGVMSHELRTPMNAVLGCAQLLSQSRLDAVQKRTLGVLEDAGRQMLALLNDLLDLASLDQDKVRLEREPVNLLRLIEDAAVIWASDIRSKGLTLSVMIDPRLAATRDVDPARLLQIIGNLMANAIKFTEQGGITISAWPQGDGLHRIAIEVEDTGPGVPAEAAERIFSPFEQVDVSTKRRFGGLGVGLHVARRLATAMGGDIELDPTYREGSRFTVVIEAPLSADGAKAAALPTSGGHTMLEQAREVLCVDDNPRNLYVLGAMLRAAGHRVTECESGEEALRAAAGQRFDVVLLDMVMPGMDGLEVLARLKAGDGPNRQTPVIACTANVLPEQVTAYLSAGMKGVLAKPIDIRAMLEAVHTAA